MSTDDGDRTMPGPEELRRIRRTSETIGYVVALLMALTAMLPSGSSGNQAVGLGAAAGLALFVAAWFRTVRENLFEDDQFLVAALALIPGAAVVLALTGGMASPYFVYCMFPLLLAVFTSRRSHVVWTGVAMLAGVLLAAVLRAGGGVGELASSAVLAAALQVVVFAVVAASIGQAMHYARAGATARAEALVAERSRAMELATIDELTGLYNRRRSSTRRCGSRWTRQAEGLSASSPSIWTG